MFLQKKLDELWRTHLLMIMTSPSQAIMQILNARFRHRGTNLGKKSLRYIRVTHAGLQAIYWRYDDASHGATNPLCMISRHIELTDSSDSSFTGLQ